MVLLIVRWEAGPCEQRPNQGLHSLRTSWKTTLGSQIIPNSRQEAAYEKESTYSLSHRVLVKGELKSMKGNQTDHKSM
jgi:hypothetical protein